MQFRLLFQAAIVVGCFNQLVPFTKAAFLEDANGKRVVQISDKAVASVDGKTVIHLSGKDLLKDIHDPAFMVVDDKTVWTDASQGALKIAVFDEGTIRHGPRTTGKAVFYYKHPDISPSFHDKRVFHVDGAELTKPQLVAALYLVSPESFKLTEQEIAEQKKEMAENAAEADKAAGADHLAGKWMVLSGSGPVEKIGSGDLAFAKAGDAYAATFDYSKKGGPSWTGVAWLRDKKEVSGEQVFYAAFGTPKSIAMCVYEIDGGKLKGAWYPWYIDGKPANTGTEMLEGPESLNGDFKITAAKQATTGKEYTGTVTIKPLEIVGSADASKPYSITWNIGGAKIDGIGIRNKNFLIVSTSFGVGADVNAGMFTIHNGNFSGDFYKLGKKEMGSMGATGAN